MTVEEAKRIKIAKVMCHDDFLFHTSYFFKHREQRQFVINSHHERISKVLELVLQGLVTKVIINMPPRYGKTEMAVVNFVSHAFSLNATARFIHLSYSHDLVNTNSEAIQNLIRSEAYQQLFPNVRIKAKSNSKKKWGLTEGGFFYATSTGGQVTGFGAGKVDDPSKASEAEKRKQAALKAIQEIDLMFDELVKELDNIEVKKGFNGAMIIDDPIKPEDADSETKRKRINERWDSTLKNRLNSRNTPVILIGQRTHEQDLSGYVMETDGYTESIEEAIADNTKWLLLSMPAIVNEGEPDEHALWDFKHTLKELKSMQEADSISFDRQYQQNPQPKEGLMYGIFRTYANIESIPLTTHRMVKFYADVADEGKDYLSAATYIETDSAMYILNVEYTQDAVKQTTPRVAMMLARDKVQIARFESNNGGGQFADSVEEQTRVIKNFDTEFEKFHQSKNKQARIYGASARVPNLIYMPEDWKTAFPKFYKAVKGYKKIGKNAHDDAPDMLTGMVEYFGADEPRLISPEQLSAFM